MDRKNIIRLHSDLLSGLVIEDISEKGLLKLGNTLLKQYRGSKAILRKLEPHQADRAAHWVAVKEICSSNIDVVLSELEQRMMTLIDEFSDGMVIAFIDLVGSINQSMVDEDRLDSAEVDDTDVELIFEVD